MRKPSWLRWAFLALAAVALLGAAAWTVAGGGYLAWPLGILALLFASLGFTPASTGIGFAIGVVIGAIQLSVPDANPDPDLLPLNQVEAVTGGIAEVLGSAAPVALLFGLVAGIARVSKACGAAKKLPTAPTPSAE